MTMEKTAPSSGIHRWRLSDRGNVAHHPIFPVRFKYSCPFGHGDCNPPHNNTRDRIWFGRVRPPLRT